MLRHWICSVFADSRERVRQGVHGLAFFLWAFLWLLLPSSFSAFLYRVGFFLCPSSLSSSFSALHCSSHLDLPFLALLSCNVLRQLTVFSHIPVWFSTFCIWFGKLTVVCAGPCHQSRLSVNTMFLEQRFHIYQKGHMWQDYERFGLGFFSSSAYVFLNFVLQCEHAHLKIHRPLPF